jgi:hypothetical protein
MFSTLVRPGGMGKALSPLRGWFRLSFLTHGLRRGLHSFAASRLAGSEYSPLPAAHNAVTDVTPCQISTAPPHQIGKLTHFSNYPLQFF